MNTPSSSTLPPVLPSENDRYYIRWRGHQEGPLPLEEIEQRLADNTIGMLHEIQHAGEWITLRAFFAFRKAQAEAARLRKEEEDRLAREEEQRLARERDERQRAQLAAEEKRKNDLLEAAVHRQQPKSEAASASPPPKSRGIYIILGIFFGSLGIHNFYAGRFGVGAGQLVLSLLAGGLAIAEQDNAVIIIVFVVLVMILSELIVVTEDGNGQKMV